MLFGVEQEMVMIAGALTPPEVGLKVGVDTVVPTTPESLKLNLGLSISFVGITTVAVFVLMVFVGMKARVKLALPPLAIEEGRLFSEKLPDSVPEPIVSEVFEVSIVSAVLPVFWIVTARSVSEPRDVVLGKAIVPPEFTAVAETLRAMRGDAASAAAAEVAEAIGFEHDDRTAPVTKMATTTRATPRL
jgi:hypothetical protein